MYWTIVFLFRITTNKGIMFVCSVDLLIMQTLFSTREALKRIFETHRKQLEQKSSYMTVANQTFGFNSRALCFLSFTTENNNDLTAIRVKLTALHSPFNTQCTPLSPPFPIFTRVHLSCKRKTNGNELLAKAYKSSSNHDIYLLLAWARNIFQFSFHQDLLISQR